jgi:hypothetical protein
MYLLCGHKYITICEICVTDEQTANEILEDMGYDDNMTDDKGYGGWTELTSK